MKTPRRSSIFLFGNTSKKVHYLKENVLFFYVFFVHIQHYFIMACENASNQNQVSLPLHCNAHPAIFNVKNGSISFLPRLLTRNESDMTQDFHSVTPQILRKEYSMNQYPCLLSRHVYGEDPRMIQGLHPLTNHLSGSVPYMAQNANLLQHQLFPSGVKMIQDFHLPTNQQLAIRSNLIHPSHLLHLQRSSNGVHRTETFHPVTDQLPPNESNIPQQSYTLAHKLPPIGIDMKQNSNMFIQQGSTNASSVSLVRQSPTHGLSQIEPRKHQAKYLLVHQQSAKESTMRQGLQSIFQRQSQDGLCMVQYPYMPGHQTIGNQGSYPSSTFPEIGFNMNQDLLSVSRDLSASNTSLDPNLYAQYSENVHICVVGPPGCGKADLIRTFARDDKILIPNGRPFRKVFQQGMVCFGTHLKIDIWHAEDIILAAEDLRSHCESSKSVIVLVYSVAQRTTLSTVLEWIKLLKRDVVTDVPIILVGNKTDVESSFDSREFSGVGVQEEYELDAFYQCSTECVDDVEAVFLFAAYKAFHRKMQRSVRER